MIDTSKKSRQEILREKKEAELREKKGWSSSLSNFSDKLRRETIRYKEVKELAEILGYEIVWNKK